MLKYSSLQVQLDGGKQFLKLSVNLVSIIPNSLYLPSPNSVLSNFIIAMGHASENSENLSSILNFTSIRKIFNLDIPIQIACDFNLINALKSLKMVKDSYMGLFRKPGWEESICLSRVSLNATGLPRSLKSHILSDHYTDYFLHYEPQSTAGAAISSDQIGEMPHSRMQILGTYI